MVATGFPFENSAAGTVIGAVVAVVSGLLWSGSQARGWLVAAVVAAASAGIIWACDRLVETDAEQVTTMLHSLARAAEREDVDAILAAIDPAMRPLRDEAKRVIRLVAPSEVRLTSVEVEPVVAGGHVDGMTARVVVRVMAGKTAQSVERGRSSIVRLRLDLKRTTEGWVITEAHEEPFFDADAEPDAADQLVIRVRSAAWSVSRSAGAVDRPWDVAGPSKSVDHEGILITLNSSGG